MAASAGPWPRATGERFVSLSTSGQGYSLWGEYGLSRGQWLVVQGSLGQNSTGQASLAWWRQLGKGEGAHRVAMGFALGTQINNTEATPYLGVSTSWGMGLTRPFSGWVSLDFDSRIGMGLTSGQMRQSSHLDATLGVNLTERVKTIWQLQGSYSGGTITLHAAPSVVYELRSGMHLELGLRTPVYGPGATDVKLGSWLRF